MYVAYTKSNGHTYMKEEDSPQKTLPPAPPCELLFIHILANGSAAEAQRAEKTTGRGETPVKAGGNISPEGATGCSATPSGFGYTPPIYRGFTLACGLNAPSGLPLGDVYKE